MNKNNKKSNEQQQIAEKLGLRRNPAQRRRRQLVIAIVVILLVGVVAWKVQGQRAKGEAVHYETVAVTRGDLVETVNATGTGK
jgi:hypothetical protein